MTKKKAKQVTVSYEFRCTWHSEERDKGWLGNLTWFEDGVAQVTITAWGKSLPEVVQQCEHRMWEVQQDVREEKPLSLPHMGDYEVYYHDK